MHSPATHPSRSLPTILVGATLVLAGPASGQLTEDFKLSSSDGAAGDGFGFSSAIADGTIAVGARGDDGQGSAYLFDTPTGMQLIKLVANDGATGDEFGFSISISDGLVAVGARFDDDNGANSGSAYIFDAATGAQLVKLLPNDGAAGDEFGFAVAVDGGIVAVGAKRDDDNGQDSGSLYLFDAFSGAQITKLLPNDGEANDNFGESVDIDDGIIAAGAHGDDENGPLSGSAYLFDVTTGAQLVKLLPLDGGTNDFFGTTIAIDDGVVAVGAWADSVVFDHSGSAYLFEAPGGSQIAKLTPSDGHDRDHFGWSIAIDGGIVAIGAEEDDDSAFDAGSAYLFDASDGTEIAEILASDGAVFDNFGTSVAIENGVVVIGAPRDDDAGSNSGSAYVLDSTLVASAEVVRVGSPPNPSALLPGVTSGPVLGATWDPIIDHTAFVPGATLDFLLISLVPGAVNIPTSIGTVLCATSAFQLHAAVPGSAFAVPVPTSISLAGLELCTQGASRAATGSFSVTNALDITLGTF